MSKDLLTTVAAGQMTDPNFSSEGESQSLVNSAGAPSVDFTKGTNDLSKEAKFTLGAYLSVKTSNAKNEYPVTFPAPDAKSLKIQSRGPGAAQLNATKNGQEAFVNDSKKDETLQSAGLGVKNASQKVGENRLVTFFDDSQIKEVLSKNASDETKSGHTLLGDVPADTTSPIGKQSPTSPKPTGESRGEKLLRAVHEQLVVGNMFSPDPNNNAKKPFLQNPGGRNEEEITRGLFSIQRNLGYFDVNGQRISVSEMSSMALATILNSVENDTAAQALLGGNINDVSVTSALGIVLRPAQFGATGASINSYKLNALASLGGALAQKASTATGQSDFIIRLDSNKNLLSQGTLPNNDELPKLQSTSRNSVSHAQMNTFLEPFAAGTRFSSVSMFTMATASTLIMIGVGLAIDALAGIAKSDSQPNGNIKNPSSLAMGRHKPEGAIAGALTKLFQVTRTDYDFGDCVGAGIALLYGLPNSSPVTLSAISSPNTALVIAENLFLAGGFYANFTRRMIASAVNVANAFSKIGGNVTQGAESVLKGIEDLLDSVVYKFIMVAAGVGDAALKSESGMFYISDDDKYISSVGKDPFTLAKSQNSADLAVNRKLLNRWGDVKGTNSLSLKTFLASQRQLPISDSLANGGISNRFSTATAQAIEDALEAEYMPFYVHDLRTQEIMSFPAFITEFGESFNANYNSIDGIGRQDPVRLYQKTERTVNFGFMLVAYNAEDHDHLWMTVNKLVAMCYPQYSAGRIRSTEKDSAGNATNFIQPFSQVQAASPMIRLRLGDVFKSNYSRFGLARLFGAGSSALRGTLKNDVQIKEAKNAVNAAEQTVIETINQIVTDARTKGAGKANSLIGTEVYVPDYVELRFANGELVKSSDLYKNPATRANFISNIQDAVVQVTGITPNGKDAIVTSTGVGSGGIGGTGAKIVLPCLVPLSAIESVTDKYLDIRIDADPNVIAARNKLATLQTNVPGSSFFDPDSTKAGGGNAIVRSFETTKGRGVAGFITSLGLDYGMGSFPWSIEMGSKAPMVVKITLGFAPITDLPLGLDYDGNIRNPSHPVGNLAGSFGDPHYSLSSQGNEEVTAANRTYINGKINETNHLGDMLRKLEEEKKRLDQLG